MRLLIVDDHRLFAEALAPTLEEAGHEVIGTATDGAGAMDLARRGRPDMVLMDLGLAGQDGADVGRQMLAELPGTKVVALTALADERRVEGVLRAGFHGYLSKGMAASRLLSVLRRISQGRTVIADPPTLASELEDGLAMVSVRQITPRERDVLGLLAEGLGNEEISRHLTISTNTVRTHVQNILAKLQVTSRLQAVAFAIRHGIALPPAPRRPATVPPRGVVRES